MLTRQELLNQASGYFLVKDNVSLNIREGRQTQHRKPIKPDLVRNLDTDSADKTHIYLECADGEYHHLLEFCPWKEGQIIYLREAFHAISFGGCVNVFYRAEGCSQPWPETVQAPQWRPSIHMPKEYARTFVRITRVWAEQVQDISEMDADDEGCDFSTDLPGDTFREKFARLWESLYPGSWDRNDWVWACEFEVIPYQDACHVVLGLREV